MLYLVPTPIGNLEDMTLRAIRILKESDLILAEDTRTSGVLLKHYDISTPLSAFHQHNEHRKTPEIIEMLASGKKISLITDAGTPGISDPGFLLSRACREANLPFHCLPGPTALIPALVQSGFPSDAFVFLGFPPQKKGRKTFIENLAGYEMTIVLYESPHRIVKLLEALKSLPGPERNVAVVREISKFHEETCRGTVKEVYELLSAREKVKGEIVVVIGGINKKVKKDEPETE
jgi:16S rRNA (cytidine1402-2'-O)-methyltransferase